MPWQRVLISCRNVSMNSNIDIFFSSSKVRGSSAAFSPGIGFFLLIVLYLTRRMSISSQITFANSITFLTRPSVLSFKKAFKLLNLIGDFSKLFSKIYRYFWVWWTSSRTIFHKHKKYKNEKSHIEVNKV